MAWYDGIIDFIRDVPENYKKYKDVIDAGGSAAKGYLDYKEQKRRNELEESAYTDYMKAAEAAGQEAQAAIDLNLTPMTVTGRPTSKADVTSFQKVAQGGIIGLKNGGDPNAGITALRKKAPGVVKAMGFNQGGGPGIEALRKKAPGVVKRMGFAMGTDPEDDPYDGMSVMEIMKLEGYPTAVESEFEEEFGPSPFESKKNKKNTNMQMAEIPKDLTMDEAVRIFKLSNDRDPISIEEVIEFFKNRKLSAKGGIIGLRKGGRPGYMDGEGPVMDGTVTSDAEGVKSKVSNELREQIEGNNLSSAAINDILYRFYEKFHPELTEETLDSIVAELQAEKVFEQEDLGILGLDNAMDMITPESVARSSRRISRGDTQYEMKKGGRVKRAVGGVMDLGGMEKDYRFNGGFVPLGEYEKKDDVPARLSKNEFVFTADAVRAAGGGSINKGAKKMYDTMKTLEAQPTAKRMTA